MARAAATSWSDAVRRDGRLRIGDGRLHGLVSLEVYGHLRTQTISPDKLFRQELTALLRSLGIAPDN
ncbi:hypothetical protein ACFWFU_32715 [Streptomyces sp. NPDC060235]|uniref:hypothetical protein n=1 Tax=Streptomyces sp. NPDC060235 TaxID=3347080 RepID=UPI003661754D